MKKIFNWILNRRWITKIILKFLSKEKQEKYYIECLKSHFLFFGKDIRNLTDEEIKIGINNMTVFLQTASSSWVEMTEAMRKLGRASCAAGEEMRKALIKISNEKDNQA
jgi:hypothetical protein